jgi:hypothetical protein
MTAKKDACTVGSKSVLLLTSTHIKLLSLVIVASGSGEEYPAMTFLERLARAIGEFQGNLQAELSRPVDWMDKEQVHKALGITEADMEQYHKDNPFTCTCCERSTANMSRICDTCIEVLNQ